MLRSTLSLPKGRGVSLTHNLQDDRSVSQQSDERVGLCATCVHAQIVTSSKGSIFYRCRLAETDPRFVRYPVLPVRSCSGYTPCDEDLNSP
jgi:hypothetical protein